MNIEYAKELVERIENDSCQQGNPVTILMIVADTDQIIDLVAKIGDAKYQSIADTIRDIKKANNRYRKVTNNQKLAIAKFLVSRFGTARAALAAAFSITEKEMFGGEMAAQEEIEVIDDSDDQIIRLADESEAEFLGFSKLKGSEKQITWAAKIRDRFIRQASPEQIEVMSASQQSNFAKFWIDHRGWLNQRDWDFMKKMLLDSKKAVD